MKKLFTFLMLLVLISGCTGGPGETPTKHSSYDLPITSRTFHMGVVSTPKSIPETTWDDTVAAYEETGDIAEVTMVWTGENIGQTERLKQNKLITALTVYGLKPVLTLSFATLKEVPGSGLQYVIDAPEGVNADLSDSEFRNLWVSEARSLANEFRPEYLSLGNEINDYFHLHPEDLDDYLSLFDEAYSAIKEASPDTKVFVVFSFTHLIDNNQWDFFEKFNDRADLIGLTTYPWKHFDTPGSITSDYYSRLETYTNKPIAFTEIGWVSENEQAEFLVKFLDLTRGINIDMVNWLFLHEVELTGIAASVSKP
ncbi:MAG: glycosyl hydrolase 53 family protein, partial [Candidatus Aenigmatarchaeota archaeon]